MSSKPACEYKELPDDAKKMLTTVIDAYLEGCRVGRGLVELCGSLEAARSAIIGLAEDGLIKVRAIGDTYWLELTEEAKALVERDASTLH